MLNIISLYFISKFTLVFSGESLAEDTGLAEKHKVGEYSYVGGKLAMAGNQSYNLAMQDAKKEFNPTNIVHVKQIGILINWLCNQAPSTFTSKGGQVNSNLSKEETLKKITTLVQTRASGYDYMFEGKMGTGVHVLKQTEPQATAQNIQ